MSKKLGKRELFRIALKNAAAMMRDGDYGSIFGADLSDEITSSEANMIAADEAVEKVVELLEKRAGL